MRCILQNESCIIYLKNEILNEYIFNLFVALLRGREYHYKRVEKICFYLSTSYFALMEGTVQLILFLPLLLVLYRVSSGQQLTGDSWMLPLKTL